MESNRFNLIDEPWIAVADAGRISLKELFSNPIYKTLGGNAVQKIAITKMLLAIVQAAATPEDDEQWAEMGVDGMCESTLSYLEKWHDRFWLYGERPFLQMPTIEDCINERTQTLINKATTNAKKTEAQHKGLPKSFGAGFYPDLPSDNNTLLSHTLADRVMLDADKAVFVVCMMNFSFGGKRVEGDLVSLGGQKLGNRYSGKSGPSLGNYIGYMHSMLLSESIQKTLWINILTRHSIENNKQWTKGVGHPPWESMPRSEVCGRAKEIKESYMGCLVAMSKFILLKDDGLFYLDGIPYPSHKEGWREPSMSVNESTNPPKFKWLDVNKKPWRELTSILSFLGAGSGSRFHCAQISLGLERARVHNFSVGIWSGGLKVRGSSGDQSVKQDDDFIESTVYFNSANLGSDWFPFLEQEMSALETMARNIYGATMGYFKAQLMDGSKIAAQTTHLFWELVERNFQQLINVCDDKVKMEKLRRELAGFAHQAYNHYCPRQTARQLDAWASSKPNLSKYLNKEAV